ncbi:hypothetical protein [Mesorhizobium sp. WSM2239]|uniref:Uncharacterized protein n=2 Tax=unclassified Mesorhizobium TaxID=325217 RepID=A0AAU8DGM2_9HYPH
MKLPKWEIHSKEGRRAMADWLDYMLDSLGNYDPAEEAYREAHMAPSIHTKPLGGLIRRLRAGQAAVEDQIWAANLLVKCDAPKKERGRPSRTKQERLPENPALSAAVREAKQIKGFWWEHYGKDYAVHDFACQFAAARNVAEWAHYESKKPDFARDSQYVKAWKKALDLKRARAPNLEELQRALSEAVVDSLHRSTERNLAGP